MTNKKLELKIKNKLKFRKEQLIEMKIAVWNLERVNKKLLETVAEQQSRTMRIHENIMELIKIHDELETINGTSI